MVPLLLLVASLGGVIAALLVPGGDDLLLLAVPCAIASLILGVSRLLRHPHPVKRAERERWPTGDDSRVSRLRWLKHGRTEPKWLVIDGSNVMHWDGGAPRIETVRSVVAMLEAQGWTPGVVFDANAGYLLAGKYQHHGALGRAVGLPEERVLVVPKGTQADAYILQAARDLGARIVTNDRYRDWQDRHPEVREPGRLIRGGYRDGALWLDLDAAPAAQRAVASARPAR